jgi:putative methyltransferase (TIGR04325 family)
MKSLLKKIIPPFFVDIFNKIEDLFTKKYPDWKSYNSKNSIDYNQEMLAKSVYLKTQKLRNQNVISDIISDKSLKESVELMFSFHDHQEMNVLDYGGASGYSYYVLKKLGYSGSLKWNIIETSEMVRMNISNKSDELFFYSDIGSMPASERLDLVLINSVLQYLPDYFAILDQIFVLNPSRICIKRTPYLKQKDYWSVQKSRLRNNGSGDMDENISDRLIKYPMHSMSLVKLVDYLKKKEHYNFHIFNVGNWVLNGKNHGLYDLYIYRNGLDCMN